MLYSLLITLLTFITGIILSVLFLIIRRRKPMLDVCESVCRTITGKPTVSVIHNLTILDRSASMRSLQTVARDGYNATLNTIREAQENYHDKQQHMVSLVIFDHEIKSLYTDVSIKDVKNLVESDYQPRGRTALLDAIGKSLFKLQDSLDAEDRTMAVITIISDGMENASKQFKINTTAILIDMMKIKYGCTVNFMGPSYKVNDRQSYAEYMAHELHIDNFIAFEYNEEGFSEAWKQHCRSSAAYYTRFNEYELATQNMSKHEREQYYCLKNQEDKFYEHA